MTTQTAPARPVGISSRKDAADPGPLRAAHTPNFPALSLATAEPCWTYDRLWVHAELTHPGLLKKSEKNAAALRGFEPFRRTLDNEPCRVHGRRA